MPSRGSSGNEVCSLWCSRWRCGHGLPATRAASNVRVIASGGFTVVPELWCWLARNRRHGGHGLAWRRHLNDHRGRLLHDERRTVGVWVGVNRLWIEIPQPADHPPPAQAPAVWSVPPSPGMPTVDIVGLEMPNIVVPAPVMVLCICGQGRCNQQRQRGQGQAKYRFHENTFFETVEIVLCTGHHDLVNVPTRDWDYLVANLYPHFTDWKQFQRIGL